MTASQMFNKAMDFADAAHKHIQSYEYNNAAHDRQLAALYMRAAELLQKEEHEKNRYDEHQWTHSSLRDVMGD